MIPLFSTQQVRNADNYAIKKLGISGKVLMENASISIFSKIQSLIPKLDTEDIVGIICGKGNNAGDGFALARHFINSGYSVYILAIAGEKELKGDALENYLILKNLIKKYSDSKLIKYTGLKDINKLQGTTILIDAMLGTGTEGELREPFLKIVQTVNNWGNIKIAIDIPTGLNADKGYGLEIFNADLTITLAELKAGLYFGKGYECSGKIEKGYIGIGNEYFNDLEVENYLVEPEDAFYAIPERKLAAHKYTSGKLLIIAGSKNMPGAAIFAANAAIKAGVGSVFCAVPESCMQVFQNKLDAAVCVPYRESDGTLNPAAINDFKNKLDWADTVLIGPGLGREELTIEAVRKILKTKNKKFIIDADAIFAVSGYLNKLDLRNSVFTPHMGEFSQLINKPIDEVQKDILKYGKEFAKKTSSILVLKGAPTIIFNPLGEAFINSTGNPGLAKFGSGDVLAGNISAFVAQTDELEDSAISSVYLQGLNADLLVDELTELSINPQNLIENIPNSLKFLKDTFE